MRLTSFKLRRLERGLLQLEVAKHTGIPCSRLSEIEGGRADPYSDELQRIAAALDMSVEHLLGSPSEPEKKVAGEDEDVPRGATATVARTLSVVFSRRAPARPAQASPRRAVLSPVRAS